MHAYHDINCSLGRHAKFPRMDAGYGVPSVKFIWTGVQTQSFVALLMFHPTTIYIPYKKHNPGATTNRYAAASKEPFRATAVKCASLPKTCVPYSRLP